MTLNLPNAAELSLSLTLRAPRLVLDPGLCLSPAGPLLVERLQSHAELWLPRELWRILDNSDYFSVRPEALQGGAVSLDTPEFEFTLRRALRTRLHGPSDGEIESPTLRDQLVGSELARTLEAWDAIRSSTDLLGLRLFWLGDGLAESLVAPGYAEDLHARFETLAEGLDGLFAPNSPLACGRRDAIALSIALGGVPILSSLEPGGVRPALCALAHTFEATELDATDPLAAIEREHYRTALVRAQCASLCWSVLSLAIVHVHAPQSRRVRAQGAVARDRAPSGTHGFEQARLFWYRA
jgi:hypothetical protein